MSREARVDENWTKKNVVKNKKKVTIVYRAVVLWRNRNEYHTEGRACYKAQTTYG